MPPSGKRSPEVGACGLDCALCPRHHTVGGSRCEGCGSEYSYASVGCKLYRCCVVGRGQETCAQCPEFPCPRLEGIDGSDSFVTHRRMMPNLMDIREHGLEEFIAQQSRRAGILDRMLHGCDEGRSKGYLCLASALLSLDGLESSVDAAARKAKAMGLPEGDRKGRNRLLRAELESRAAKEGLVLVLRRSRKSEE